MLVMFSDNAVLMLGIIDTDLQKLRNGLTLEYIDPPHPPQLVQNVVVMYGKDKEDVIGQLRQCGVKVTEADLAAYRRGERTDRPRKDH